MVAASMSGKESGPSTGATDYRNVVFNDCNIGGVTRDGVVNWHLSNLSASTGNPHFHKVTFMGLRLTTTGGTDIRLDRQCDAGAFH